MNRRKAAEMMSEDYRSAKRQVHHAAENLENAAMFADQFDPAVAKETARLIEQAERLYYDIRDATSQLWEAVRRDQ